MAEVGHIWDRELVLVTGKGGVGKTSVTAALAKAAHRAGRRVLVGEVTPDTSTVSNLLSLFGQPRPDSEDPIELAANLYGVRITPTIGHKLFLKAALKIGLLVDTAMRSAALTRFLLAAPAFPEIGTFYQLVTLLRQKRYDHLILDLPATGHAIGLISLPKTVLRVLPAGLIGDAIKEGLEVLTNPKRTGAVLVTLPESLPVTESLELCDAMRHHQVAVRSMILNRMPAEPFSPLELQALDHHLAHRPGDRLLLGTKELRRLERALEARDLFRERVPPEVERVEVPALEIKSQAAVVDHLANALAAVRIGGRAVKLRELVEKRRIIVCCGAGGVGKTTTSAALALAAARQGRRALVLTIDPARRLAQALGIPPTGKEPVRIGEALLSANKIHLAPGGELHAWMLDPKVVLESVVDRFAPSAEDAAKIRSTRLYQTLGDVIIGLQEYTAAEALYSFREAGLYDLIILDTPPSRNALDFLDAPRRLTRFLDERTLSIFAPDPDKKHNAMVRAAAKVVSTALARTFGESFSEELQTFLNAFGKLFNKMRIHASGVRKLLRSEEAAFVVIASPEEAALEEAIYFKGRIKELGLITDGFILNRSYASDQPLEHPRDVRGTLAGADPHLLTALVKLEPLADIESGRITADRALLLKLEKEGRTDDGNGATALPILDDVIEDLQALNVLSDYVLAS